MRIRSSAGLGLVVVVLALACGPGLNDGASNETSNEASNETSNETSDGISSSPATTETPTADSTSGGPLEPGSLGMGYGVILLELHPGQSETEDPFIGTSSIQVTLIYLECITVFYNTEMQWQQDGMEGPEVFEAARSMGLCDPGDSTLVECEVAEIRQELDTATQLSVFYDVSGPLEGKRLRFGPLPTAGLAACEAGSLPIVRVGNSAAIRGLDATGEPLWVTESFDPAEAATDQGAPITIRVTRIGS